ncbi:purine and uridine phosphorylase [Fusarium beomiforme]|uniref:Purine and uridine phosphorylase n=1 Tax=Fusarium beomiforme TaxID=44412 RepID=A0A9P5AAA2_9HYPO|nr:purine and uridine phosphorylase [Fusarium beomiforme]
MHFEFSKSHRRKQESKPVEQSVASNAGDQAVSTSCVEGPGVFSTTTMTLNLKADKPNAATSKPSPNTTEYIAGWICALPVEMAAAEGMLDEVFQNPLQAKLDENFYAVGRIAHIKTVIVCLPYKAAVCSIGGCWGGMPSREVDVRLGDIVVGISSDGSPAVIQYDYGKEVPNGGFKTTGYLNPPPEILLKAIARMETQGLLRPSERLLSMEMSITKLHGISEGNWLHPGKDNDLLFTSNYRHEEENSTCKKCDINCLEDRPQRGSMHPKIHYGTIASGNRVMRDGVAREILRAEKNAICVEMEAAGIMNIFPCLVIRGICDYADSHKNKNWQAYAAAVAAAYAKELLSAMPKHE